MSYVDKPKSDNLGNPTNSKFIDDNKTSQKKYKNLTSKKQKNKDENIIKCPFACTNCAELGNYLESRYEPICILCDTGDSIFSPMHERYYDDHKDSVREGKVYFAAEVVNDLLRKFKK